MRLPFLALAFAALAGAAVPAGAQRAPRDQDEIYQAIQRGEILPLAVLRSRIHIPGAEFIGAELVAPTVYRLKYMRGSEVIWIDVDARTGRVLGRVR